MPTQQTQREMHSRCRRPFLLIALLSFFVWRTLGFSLEKTSTAMAPPTKDAPKQVVHKAPAGVDYSLNKSAFGSILRGEIPAKVLKDTEEFLVFEDRTPHAPLHALVIPKRFVRDVTHLRDMNMVSEMKEIALSLVRERFPSAVRENDYILCFHIPPFTSVQHLHLHVLAPASTMSWFWSHGKYRSETPWCTGVERVQKRLAAGKQPIPWFPSSS